MNEPHPLLNGEVIAKHYVHQEIKQRFTAWIIPLAPVDRT